MDLMTIAAKLTLDDSGFNSGINSAESAGEKLSGKLSSMTVAVGNIMSNLITKGYQTVTNLVSGAVDAYASYEQLSGGVETLFKSSSGKVQKYAQEAYKNAGISSNQYMETVTSFSASLLQGLKGDTDAAAELANLAITDMSDNANKMGTDITSIQTAYQGFAKQNYTMLDNLKLGYGGTKDEMVRLVNESGILETEIEDLDGITFDQLISAIHAVQTQMGITGTTAEEAEKTLEGSKNAMKAAWSDLLSVVGGEGDQARMDEAMENFKSSFSTYMENFIPTLVRTIVNGGSLITTVAEAVSSLPTDLLSTLFNAGVEGGTEAVSGLDTLVTWIIDSLTTLFKNASIHQSDIAEFGEAFGLFLGNTVSNIIMNIQDISEGLLTVGITLAGSIIKGIWQGLFGDGNDELNKIKSELTDTISDAEVSSAKAQGILNYMQDLTDKYGSAAKETNEWKTAESQLEEILGGSSQTFKDYGDNVQGAITHLKDMVKQLRILAIQNAYEEKLTSLYKLQAEYQMEIANAQTRSEIAQNQQAEINETYVASSKAYAQELMNGNALQENSSDWWTAWNVINTEGYADKSTAEKLSSLLSDYYEDEEVSENDQIWNKDEEDNIVRPETIAELSAAYEEAENTIKSTPDTIKEAEDNLKLVNAEITVTETAATKLYGKLESLTTAASNAASNLNSISKISITSGTDNGAVVVGNTTYTPKAVGIDYVPYDGYKVELHRGEAVLTKEENESRNQVTDYDLVSAQLEEAIENAMSKMQINMSGEKVGDLTTSRVNNNISSDEHSRVRALGG